MKYFLDTEFIEYPCTIQLISIGIVCEDGREYYAISREFDYFMASDWVKENVIRNLEDIERKPLYVIKQEILAFIGDDKPEFWGYYADYDWIVFCWLFGYMIDLPRSWPKYCKDIKQLVDQYNVDLSQNNEHNALADARWNKKAFEYINNFLGVI